MRLADRRAPDGSSIVGQRSTSALSAIVRISSSAASKQFCLPSGRHPSPASPGIASNVPRLALGCRGGAARRTQMQPDGEDVDENLVRGTPALLMYRRDVDLSSRKALALMSSTQLPLVLGVTALAIVAGRTSPSIAADLVGAAVLSTITLPLLALRMRRRRPNLATSTPVPVPELSPA